MALFVRKNIVVATTTFTAADGSMTQPSAANLALSYQGPGGVQQNVSVPMAHNTLTGAWTAEWDSSASINGTVFWMIYGYGLLQASTEGSFDIAANAANTV